MFKIHGYVNFRSFIITLVIGAALLTVDPMEQWSGNSNKAFRIGSTAFAQETAASTLKSTRISRRIRKNLLTPTALTTTASTATTPLVIAKAGPSTTTPPPTPNAQTINLSGMSLDSGFAYAVSQNFGTPADSLTGPTQSGLRIFENGMELAPAHSQWTDISTKGQGRFVHWQNSSGAIRLYLSASDNTNPQTNGRTYTYRTDLLTPAASTTIAPTLTPTTPITIAPTLPPPASTTTASSSTTPLVVAQATPPPAPNAQTINLSGMSLDSGFAYAVSQNFGTPADSLTAPTQSGLRIFENGMELAPAHSQWTDISTKGQGRFVHWQNSSGAITLYLSTSDNTDPRQNGRMYTYQLGSTPAPTPKPLLTVNGSSAPITVAGGTPVTLSVQNAPGSSTDCVTLDFIDFAGFDGVHHQVFAWVTGNTMTVSFAMPTPTGVYAGRYWQGCATQLAISPTVTVGSLPPPPPPPSPVPAPPSVSGCPSDAFYVSTSGNDSNPGTQTAPWRTIGKAASTLTAGQTACVKDGTYTEPQVSFNNSGSASAPIMLMGEHPWDGPGTTPPAAVLNSTAGCNPAISIAPNGPGNYITIQHLRIGGSTGCGTQTSANVNLRAWGGSFLTVRYVYFDKGDRAEAFKTNGDYTIFEFNESHNEVEAMSGTGIIFRNNVIWGGGTWGSSFTSKGGATNFQAYNNVLHLPPAATDGGLVLGGSTSSGIGGDGSECVNCVAYNNVVLNETGRQTVALFIMRACKDCLFLNNVGIGGQLGIYQGGPSSNNLSANPVFKNNILTCGSDGVATGGIGWQNFTNLTVDYNNFYQCSSGVPVQSHAISGDPKFVNPSSDWHLQPGSPALGSGIEVNVFGVNGEVIDIWKNWDGIIRSIPVNLGIY